MIQKLSEDELKFLCFRLESSYYNLVNELAEETDRSKASALRRIVKEYFDRQNFREPIKFSSTAPSSTKSSGE